MRQELILTTSKEHIAKTLFKGLLFWIAFNLGTGILTGDTSLADNYFILFLVIAYVAFIASYKVKIDRGHITTYQASMVTNNINLFKASEVINEKGRLTVIYPDDARFPVKFLRFNEADQIKAIELTVPQKGERAKIAPEIIEQHERDKVNKRKSGYTNSIFGGFNSIILAIVAVATDVIYLPSREGFIYLEDDPRYFYIWLTILIISGIGLLIYGFIGKRKYRNA
jgi:hypothetical protein